MQPIPLNFKPSYLLSALIAFMTLGAVIILILLEFSWQIKLSLVLVVMASASYSLCRFGLLLLPWSCVALNINAKNQMQIVLRSSVKLEVVVQEISVVTPYLTVINTLIPKHVDNHALSLFARVLLLLNRYQYSIVVLPDSLNAESYRQIRVWLRWNKLR